MKDKILRYWTYFRRGHNIYLVMFVSFMNFIVIQYRLLIEAIPTLKAIFSHMIIFLISFIVAYIPVAIMIGWWDYKRGAVPTESILNVKASPYVKDTIKIQKLNMEALILYMNNKREEANEKMKKALKILEKWNG